MMKRKGLTALILILLLLILAACGAAFFMLNFAIVNFHLYPKDAKSLDLRGEDLSLSQYRSLQKSIPGCDILWNVPFQGRLINSDAEEITLTELSEDDILALACFPNLTAVHAEGCTDYEALMHLGKSLPNVNLTYTVTLEGTDYAQDADLVELTAVTEEDVMKLAYLPDVSTVIVSGGGRSLSLPMLQSHCQNAGITFLVRLGNELVETSAADLTVQDVTDEELSLLGCLPGLKRLHLVNPQAEPETVFALDATYPNVQTTWEIRIGDASFQSTDTEIDLSQTVVTDLADVERKMKYLPNAETVIFGLCGIDNPNWGNSKTKNLAVCEIENEALSEYRDRVRDKYKVVWTVRLGPSIALRTDKDNFMPNHFGVGQFFDDYTVNLKYCEDMVCLDLGHMTMHTIDFVTYMPKLKYLILAWTEVQYIEPIRTCKNLIWLELDNSCIRDYSPLVDCTALEDLNIGKTFCDITPVLQMTWLKNLYMIFGNGGDAWKASQALPNTHVVASGDATVGGGWRRLPNYYAMRDALHTYYMN